MAIIEELPPPVNIDDIIALIFSPVAALATKGLTITDINISTALTAYTAVCSLPALLLSMTGCFSG